MKSNKMLMEQNNAGFTLVNMLIVIAVIAILSVGAYPVFSTLIEKSWEAADISSVRSAFDHVSAEALMGNKTATVTVDLKQKQADWQSMDPVNIRGIIHHKGEGDTANWKGVASRAEAASFPTRKPSAWCSHGAAKRLPSPNIRLTPV